jgi:MFS family permease
MIEKSIETRQSWVVVSVALLAMGFSFGAPWITVVALKAIAADLGGTRSTPALAGSLSWFGVGFGGLVMGHIADRIGVRWTVMFGALMICVGLAISSFGAPWQLYVGHGLFIGFLGNGGINAPLYVYVSRWFDRRRGSALALISSGAYLAGAVWPPIFERLIAVQGWRQTMWSFGLLEMAVIIPLAAIFLAPPPDQKQVRSWPPNVVFCLLCVAAFLCCMPMALPQTHLIAFCSDLGIVPTHGAAMLSVVLGTGFLCRQLWGWFSDRAGGLATVLLCSAIQASALTAFLLTQDEIGLFTVSALFGLGFSGLVPAYVLTARQFYPAREARWRVPTLLLFSGSGMATGAWAGGALYDMFGYYGPAFFTAISANLLNLVVVATLFLRQHSQPHGTLKIA